MSVDISEYKAGPDLVGHKVSIWKVNSYTRKSFKAFGIVIKYQKSRKKGYNGYLVEFPPTNNQKESFKQWFRRSSITQES